MPRPLFSHVLNLKQLLRNQLLIQQTNTAGTLTTLSEVTVVDTTSGNITVTLPLSSLSRGRQIIIVKSVLANNLTIQRGGADTIGYAGATSFLLSTQDAKALLIADGGTVWLKILP
jgi:cysteine synthase